MPNLPVELKQGSIVGNFVILEKIGDGGIGAVYKAQHRLLNYTAAVKVHQHFANNEIIGVAFLQAANYLSQLTHPNIIRLYDYGFSNGHAYLAMEFVEGQTLDRLIPKTQTKEWITHTIEYFVQLLSAVRHAHNCIYLNLAGEQQEGIAHGDIKPQNVFVTKESGHIKLTDFMIPDVQEHLGKEMPNFTKLLAPYAKPLTPKERARLTDDIYSTATDAFGTPRYMPPEQYEGKVSVQTDIFTLGATLYEMVTHHPPMSLFKSGITPTKINPFVPRWMEDVIIQAMKPDPSERFYSVAEMESIFREHLIQQAPQSINFMVREWLMGDKIDIKMGDISNNGQLFIGKFNKTVANLNSSGQGEFADAIKTLKDAVMASAYISDDKKKEHIEVISQIGDETTKEKPNKTLIKILGDGLLSVLKTIPDIAKAVSAIAPFLTHTP